MPGYQSSVSVSTMAPSWATARARPVKLTTAPSRLRPARKDSSSVGADRGADASLTSSAISAARKDGEEGDLLVEPGDGVFADDDPVHRCANVRT